MSIGVKLLAPNVPQYYISTTSIIFTSSTGRSLRSVFTPIIFLPHRALAQHNQNCVATI